MRRHIPAALLLLSVLIAGSASAACVNKYTNRSEGPRQIMTLLTGKLTFAEAQELAKAINERQAPPLEWVDAKGKSIAKQFGALKIVRPMPVGCDGKRSGVVMVATFTSVIPPAKSVLVKFNDELTVNFEEQASQ
jgi:hypothetical protein